MLTSEKRVKNFSHALGKGAGSVVAFCLAVIVVWPVGALLAYHVRVSDIFFSFCGLVGKTHRAGISFSVLM